jgi:TPR repeat protein
MRQLFILAIIALLSSIAGAQSGSPDALYDRALDAITGVGPSRNDQQGLDYFRRSAELGYGPAQVAMGYYFENGLAGAPNQAQAITFYRKAAQTGDPLGAWLAGRLYFLGTGVPRDLDAAQKLFKLAASQNSAYGSYYLGRLMADRDATKAPALYKVAADQGLPQAQYFYGKALKEGKGITQDPFNAYIWLVVAADAGYSAAGSEAGGLESVLTPDQVEQAKAKARNLEQIVVRAVNSRGCAGWDGEFAEFPTPPPPQLQRFCR